MFSLSYNGRRLIKVLCCAVYALYPIAASIQYVAAHPLHDAVNPRRSTMPIPDLFPSAAMVVPDGEWGARRPRPHAVIDEGKPPGVYVFGGGIDEDVPPCSSLLTARCNGRLSLGAHARWRSPCWNLPSRDEAIAWAARIAKACRCDQELRVFGFDPQS